MKLDRNDVAQVAMIGLLIGGFRATCTDRNDNATPASVAQQAFAIADAMIVEAEKKNVGEL